MTAGLSDTGLEIKTQPEIQAELEESQRANVSARINTQADSLVGNYNGIVSDQLASLWELARDIYHSGFPNLASGYSLSQLVQLTRTRRRAATYSTVTCTVEVDPGTYAAGSLVAIVEGRPTSRFVNLTEVTNPGASPDTYTVVFQAEETGPVAAPSGTLVIGEPVTGWVSLDNAEDADLGLPIETDAELRLRRTLELASGSSTADAIRAAILRNLSASGVVSARVVVNDTDTTVDSMPPHSVECIVYGPASPTVDDDTALANVIRAAKADGIQAYGQTETITVTDAQGNESNIGFTRPSDVDIYVDLDLQVEAATYAGDDAVKAAVLALESVLRPGDPVSYFAVMCAAMDVAGVVDINAGASGIGTSLPTSNASIAISVRQRADFDTSRITVTTTEV